VKAGEELKKRIVVMNLSLILHPLDYSAGAKPALARALALAKWRDADLHVLHVRSHRRGFDGEEAAHARLRKFVEARNPEGAKFETVILAGDPVTAVADYARHKTPDLLVVDRHGRQASKLWRAGVFARELARRVACPTLTVPNNHDGANSTADPMFGEILCATDFLPASMAALKQALILAQQSGGRLTVLHVLDGFPYESVYSGSGAFRLIDEYRGLVAQVSRQLRDAIPQDALNWCDVQTRVVSGVAHRTILATAVEIKPDLIVMGLPVRSAFGTVTVHSTTGPVVRGTQCPVLMVPVPAKSQTLMTPSRAPALDSDLDSMVPGHASHANPIGGLALW
jgi:nucleotide-binding universal stress UspA family protein